MDLVFKKILIYGYFFSFLSRNFVLLIIKKLMKIKKIFSEEPFQCVDNRLKYKKKIAAIFLNH